MESGVALRSVYIGVRERGPRRLDRSCSEHGVVHENMLHIRLGLEQRREVRGGAPAVRAIVVEELDDGGWALPIGTAASSSRASSKSSIGIGWASGSAARAAGASMAPAMPTRIARRSRIT